MKILVVDDQAHKRQKIRDVIMGQLDGMPVKLVEAEASVPAKAALSGEAFDLMVLDVAMPYRGGEPVRRDAGIELLSDLAENDTYRMPTHIAALTAYPDIFQGVLPRLAGLSIGTILFDESSDEWKMQLSEILGRIAAAQKAQLRELAIGKYDVGIVCALSEPELDAVEALEWKWRTVRYAGDPSAYREGALTREDGRILTAVTAASARMGMPSAAALSAKIANVFRPQYLIMPGITAGNPDKVRMSDIIAADPSWDCGSGKWLLENGEVRFEQAPHQLGLDQATRDALRLLSSNEPFFSSVRQRWRADKPDFAPRLRVGPLASNAAVLADGSTLKRVISQHRETLGVEMEAYGVFAAAEMALEPRPRAIALKCVVDFANGEKNDKYREYSAYVSATTVEKLLSAYLT